MINDNLFEVALGSPLVAPLKRRLEAGDFLSLNSVADAAKPFIIALLSQISDRPILVVTHDLKSQEAFFNDLQTFLPTAQFYPAWETLPHEDVLPHADTIALVRSCAVDSVVHAPAHYQMNSGRMFMGFPSLGSWVTYGLGSETQNLPAFVVMAQPQGTPEDRKSVV